MGVIFAPCYANLAMGFWEEHSIWTDNPFMRHLVFYGRYIDDVFIIWDGDANSFLSFVAYCNTNDLGLLSHTSLTLTSDISGFIAHA